MNTLTSKKLVPSGVHVSTAVNKAGGLLVDGSFIACIGPSEDPNDSLLRRASGNQLVVICRLFVAAVLIGC